MPFATAVSLLSRASDIDEAAEGATDGLPEATALSVVEEASSDVPSPTDEGAVADGVGELSALRTAAWLDGVVTLVA